MPTTAPWVVVKHHITPEKLDFHYKFHLFLYTFHKLQCTFCTLTTTHRDVVSIFPFFNIFFRYNKNVEQVTANRRSCSLKDTS